MKILFLTVVKNSEFNPKELKNLKPVGYIEKPFENDDLLEKINKIFS